MSAAKTTTPPPLLPVKIAELNQAFQLLSNEALKQEGDGDSEVANNKATASATNFATQSTTKSTDKGEIRARKAMAAALAYRKKMDSKGMDVDSGENKEEADAPEWVDALKEINDLWCVYARA